MSARSRPRVPVVLVGAIARGLAILTALAALATWLFYFRINPTPTVFAGVFFITATVAAAIAAVAAWRVVRLALLAGVTGACIPFGVLSMPTLFGLLPLGVALLAASAIVVVLTVEWYQSGTASLHAAFSAIGRGFALGLAFCTALWMWTVVAAP